MAQYEDGMRFDVSASGLVREFGRRKIEPDKTAAVTQGTLLLWMYCNSFVVELYCGSSDGELKPGMVTISNGAYINTYSPQEIADHLTKGKELDIALIGGDIDLSGVASALGRKGGAAKSPRKSASSRANGAKGGRPKKGKA